MSDMAVRDIRESGNKARSRDQATINRAIEVSFYASSWASRYVDFQTWHDKCDPEIVYEFEKNARCAAAYALACARS